jgi:hypothetical protein
MKKEITLSLDDSLIERVKSKLGKKPFSSHITRLLEDDLLHSTSMTKTQKTNAAKTDADIHQKMKDQVLQLVNTNPKLLQSLPEKDQAKLLLQYLPKQQKIDEDLNATALSLGKMLENLPDLSDINKELIKSKAGIIKMSHENAIKDEFIKVMRKEFRKIKQVHTSDAQLTIEQTTGQQFWKLIINLLNEILKRSHDYRLECEARFIDYEEFELIKSTIQTNLENKELFNR